MLRYISIIMLVISSTLDASKVIAIVEVLKFELSMIDCGTNFAILLIKKLSGLKLFINCII